MGWTEEVSVLTWLWICWGAAFVLSEKEEVRFDIIYGNISDNLRRVFTAITGIAVIFRTAFRCPRPTDT